MLISAVVGAIVGLLVAHFLATWILVLWTLFVVYIFWDIFHSRGGAEVGILLLFGPGLACSVLSMWILWLFLPGGAMDTFSFVHVWEFAKKIFLR